MNVRNRLVKAVGPQVQLAAHSQETFLKPIKLAERSVERSPQRNK
jgi:hypothetical protein